MEVKTAQEVADDLNGWGFAGQGGFCVYERTPDGYIGGAFYTQDTRIGAAGRLLIRSQLDPWSPDEVDEEWERSALRE